MIKNAKSLKDKARNVADVNAISIQQVLLKSYSQY